MLDLIYIAAVLSIPFLFGVVVGVEIVNRRPKPRTDVDQLGEMVLRLRNEMLFQLKFVGEGFSSICPCKISRAGDPTFYVTVSNKPVTHKEDA
jgi:hypothetical protein